MNIGIDLDGVLFDTESQLRALASIYNKCGINADVVDSETIRNQYRFAWNNDQLRDFLDKTILPVIANAPVMPFAKRVMQLLKDAGHNLYSITARGIDYPEELAITERRLKEENIVFDKVYYVRPEKKIDKCKELGIDLMIDDLDSTIESLSNNGFKCLYYRDLILKFIDNPKVTEVRNWGEIYSYCVDNNIIPPANFNDYEDWI